MWLPRNEVPDNSALQPIAFASKGLMSTETHYSAIERELLGILHGLENSITTALQQGKYINRS